VDVVDVVDVESDDKRRIQFQGRDLEALLESFGVDVGVAADLAGLALRDSRRFHGSPG
jgi:SHS2 domain-containing protein